MKPLNTNKMFIALLLVIMVSIVAIMNIGAKQDQNFLQDYANYLRAEQLIVGKKYTETQDMLKPLIEKDPINFRLLWRQGLCEYRTGDNITALVTYEEVEKLRPYVLEDQEFLYEKGEILYSLGRYSEALKYLDISQKVRGKNPELLQSAKELIGKIKSNQG